MEQFLYEDLYKQEDKHWWHLSKRAVVVELVKKYLRVKNPKILDLGCGAGKNVEELSQFGEVWGVDVSEEAVKFCKKRGIKNVKVGSAYKTGFAKGEFNLVTLLDVLEHTDEGKTLTEVGRILNHDGLLIINVPAFSWLWSKWDEVLHHKRRYTKERLEKVLKRHGFKVEKISYMFSFLVVPALVLRFIKSSLSKDNYSSDFNYSNDFINKLMFRIAGLERKLMMFVSIPVGTSLICVARKVE